MNVGCFSEVCEKATNRSSVLRPTAPFHSLATPDVSEDNSAGGGSSSSTQDLQTRHQAAVQSKRPMPMMKPHHDGATFLGTTREANSIKSLFVKYRESFLRCLSGDSTQIGTAAVRVLVRKPGIDVCVQGRCAVVGLIGVASEHESRCLGHLWYSSCPFPHSTKFTQ